VPTATDVVAPAVVAVVTVWAAVVAAGARVVATAVLAATVVVTAALVAAGVTVVASLPAAMVDADATSTTFAPPPSDPQAANEPSASTRTPTHQARPRVAEAVADQAAGGAERSPRARPQRSEDGHGVVGDRTRRRN